MNPFDEMDGIMRSYVLLLRQANLEKRLMESALNKIANGVSDPQAMALETLISIERLRGKNEAVENPEMGMAVNFAERRGSALGMRDLRERLFSRAGDGSLAAVPGGEMSDNQVS